MFRSSRDMIRTHIDTNVCKEEEDELHGCEYCSEGGWYSETEVEIHKSVKHRKKLKSLLNNNENVCGICIKEFADDDNLLRHFKTEHLYSSADAYRVEWEIFFCDDCSQLFFNKQHLIVHISQNHSNETDTKLVECPKCNINIKKKQMWLHFYKHMVQSVSTCRICFIKLKNQRELKEHLSTHGHHLKCNMCGYDSKKSCLFKQHINENHKRKNGHVKKLKRVKRYFLPKHDTLAGKTQMLMIFRGVIITNGIKICVLCREICVGQQQMWDHIVLEHSTTEIAVKNEYRCTCGDVFNNKVLLKHHIFKSQGDHRILKVENRPT